MIYLYVGLAIYLAIIIGTAWLQLSRKVTGVDGVVYRIQLGPTGVPRISAVTNYDASVCLAPIYLGMYLLRKDRGWSVEVTAARGWRHNPTLVAERLPDHRTARDRFDSMVDGIEAGNLAKHD